MKKPPSREWLKPMVVFNFARDKLAWSLGWQSPDVQFNLYQDWWLRLWEQHKAIEPGARTPCARLIGDRASTPNARPMKSRSRRIQLQLASRAFLRLRKQTVQF